MIFAVVSRGKWDFVKHFWNSHVIRLLFLVGSMQLCWFGMRNASNIDNKPMRIDESYMKAKKMKWQNWKYLLTIENLIILYLTHRIYSMDWFLVFSTNARKIGSEKMKSFFLLYFSRVVHRASATKLQFHWLLINNAFKWKFEFQISVFMYLAHISLLTWLYHVHCRVNGAACVWI